MTEYLAFDLETTNSNRQKAYIVEYCFIVLDENLVEKRRLKGRLRPPIPIPREATAIHGIRDEDVRDCPVFKDVAHRILSLFHGRTVIGHNVLYDLEVLRTEFIRNMMLEAFTTNVPCIDTLTIERFVRPNTLGELYQRYTGQSHEQWHGAEADIDAALHILRRQLEQHHDILPNGLKDATTSELQRRTDEQAKGLRRTYLEDNRKFYRFEDEQTVRFAFGKYEGEPINEHRDYLLWMVERGDFPNEVRIFARNFLETVAPPAMAA